MVSHRGLSYLVLKINNEKRENFDEIIFSLFYFFFYLFSKGGVQYARQKEQGQKTYFCLCFGRTSQDAYGISVRERRRNFEFSRERSACRVCQKENKVGGRKMLSEKERLEMEQLQKDPLVKLAQATITKKVDPEKKRLYQLRWLQKQGKKIVDETKEV